MMKKLVLALGIVALSDSVSAVKLWDGADVEQVAIKQTFEKMLKIDASDRGFVLHLLYDACTSRNRQMQATTFDCVSVRVLAPEEHAKVCSNEQCDRHAIIGEKVSRTFSPLEEAKRVGLCDNNGLVPEEIAHIIVSMKHKHVAPINCPIAHGPIKEALFSVVSCDCICPYHSNRFLMQFMGYKETAHFAKLSKE